MGGSSAFLRVSCPPLCLLFSIGIDTFSYVGERELARSFVYSDAAGFFFLSWKQPLQSSILAVDL